VLLSAQLSSKAPIVEVSGLAAGYGGPPALEGVSFTLGQGERIAVLGPNGGGKSTLFRALLGELVPLAGRVRVGVRCATVPQTERSRLDYPVSALDVALMGTLGRLPWWRRPGRAERRQALDALDVVGLGELSDRSFGQLSGGQRQRVLMARALLDEPFTGVDEPSTERLMALIDRLAGEGKTLMIATHDVRQAGRWDSVLCLNRRQIAFGRPEQTLTREVLEATHGAALVMIPAEDASAAAHAAVILPPHHHHTD
jgi:ABC-type Mn2+/Zn2+ transport system ATPase subunit